MVRSFEALYSAEPFHLFFTYQCLCCPFSQVKRYGPVEAPAALAQRWLARTQLRYSAPGADAVLYGATWFLIFLFRGLSLASGKKKSFLFLFCQFPEASISYI